MLAFISCVWQFQAFALQLRLSGEVPSFQTIIPTLSPSSWSRTGLTGSGAQQQFLGGLGPTRCPQATGQSLTPVGDLQTLQRCEAWVPPPADQDFSLPTVLPALKMEQEQDGLQRWPHVQAFYINHEACGAGVTAWGQNEG